jgi:hypothetical protein
MSRRIVTTQYQSTGGSQEEVDTYFDRIVKYIPVDIVGAWITTTGLIASANDVPKAKVLWIAFSVGLLLTAAWTYKQTADPNKPTATTQIAVSVCSFLVWVFALGGPFVYLAFYRPIYGSLTIIVYSLAVGLITPRQ